MFTLTSPAVRDGYLDIRYGINTPDQSTVVEGIPQVSFPFNGPAHRKEQSPTQ